MILIPVFFVVSVFAWMIYRDHFYRGAARNLVRAQSAEPRSLHTGRRR